MSLIQRYTMARLLVSLLGLIAATQGYAMTYSAGLENSEWHTKGSALECRLWQPIPSFGDGIFTMKAGGGLFFYLKPGNSRMAPGTGKISAEAPSWKPSIDVQNIAEVDVTDDLVPVTVKPPYADMMLASLNQGLVPTITSPDNVAAGYLSVKVGVSSVNFHDAYTKYERCVSNLLPVSYQQIARSTIFYSFGKTKLADDVREQLDLIIRYMKADKHVSRVVIDGHTDASGDKQANIGVSKQRAYNVTAYFKQAGISNKRIVTRWHGDKYPVLPDDSDENRARNRRVTIRLDLE